VDLLLIEYEVFRLFNPYLPRCSFDGYIDFRDVWRHIPLVFILNISLKTAAVVEVVIHYSPMKMIIQICQTTRDLEGGGKVASGQRHTIYLRWD
jgi:hypothetical protein